MPENGFKKHLPVIILGIVLAVLILWGILAAPSSPQLSGLTPNAFLPATCNVSIIAINGALGTMRQEGYVNSLDIALTVQGLAGNGMNRALIFLIDSFGGSAAASEEIGDAIQSAGLPTVAVVRSSALSGGYWIAAKTDHIIALSTAAVGSIGATSSYLDETKLNEKEGYTFQEIVSGRFKEIGNINKPLSSVDRAYLQDYTDKISVLFEREVQASRGLTDDQMAELRDAKFYLAEEGIKLGLVDEIGGINEAKNYLAKRLEADPASLVLCDPVRFEPYEPPASDGG